MSLYTKARQARRALDAGLQCFDVEALVPPVRGGYVRAIREALQMSASDLGSRMGVSRQAVAAREASECAGTIQLGTLQGAAAAMGCELVYAIVPSGGGTFEGIVQRQAGRIADNELAAVTHTMALEDRAVEPLLTDRAAAIEDLLHAPGRLLWSAR